MALQLRNAEQARTATNAALAIQAEIWIDSHVTDRLRDATNAGRFDTDIKFASTVTDEFKTAIVRRLMQEGYKVTFNVGRESIQIDWSPK